MKILIVSDTHGRIGNLQTVLQKVGRMNLLIHLGDVESGIEYIKEVAKCSVEIVGGNGDGFLELEDEKMITIGRYKTFLAHGHRHRVKMGLNYILDYGVQRQANVIMFGHTHQPIINNKHGITILNPGSLTFPRQEGHKPSFIIMDIDNKGEAHFTLNYL